MWFIANRWHPGLGRMFLTIVVAIFLFACSKDTPPSSDEGGSTSPTEQKKTIREQYSTATSNWPKAEWYEGATPRELQALIDNPNTTTSNPEVVALGKALFFDPRIGSGNNSCASCHNPDSYWVDRKITAEGIATHHRNTPTMENVWYLEGHLFHDGRAKTYREQIAEAIESPIEMGGDTYTLPAKLQAIPGYVSMYHAAYGTSQITREGLLDAIAAYSKSISSGETAFDRFVLGDYEALTDQQIEGLHLFRTKGKCINCHNGPFFTDLQYHNLGYAVDRTGELDNGRYEATGFEADKGKFRTPGLRNVAHTMPYMHNGSIKDLETLISLLNQGMPQQVGQQINGTLSPYIRSLRLTGEEQKAIIAFIHALSSEVPNVVRPVLPQ